MLKVSRKLVGVIILVVITLVAAGYIISTRNNDKQASMNTTSLSEEEQLQKNIDILQSKNKAAIDEVVKQQKSEEAKLDQLASDISKPIDLSKLDINSDLKIRLAIKLAKPFLDQGDAKNAFNYLSVVDNSQSRLDFDFLFLYYISARDSNETIASDLRVLIVNLLKQQNGIAADVK